MNCQNCDCRQGRECEASLFATRRFYRLDQSEGGQSVDTEDDVLKAGEVLCVLAAFFCFIALMAHYVGWL